jgi:signal transduction histidine kinase
MIDDLRQSYKLTKPRGLGLTTKLRKEWELWSKEADRLKVEVFEPAKQQIRTVISEAVDEECLSKQDLLQRVDRALKDKILETRTAIDTENSETNRAAEDVRKQALQIAKNSVGRIGDSISDVKRELIRLKQSTTKEGSILGEYYKLEASLNDAVDRERLILENTRLRLLQAMETSISGDEVIEALEEENLALHEQSESDVELAQLGMAVAVISHEFESTVRSIRNNLLRLRGWADVNKELRDLYREVRADFDHLEAYLQLFTPLERRSVRNKVVIRGSDIAKYLRDLFAERLRTLKVEIQTTKMFSSMAVKGYPATFYPVFVNLIDNSLFWLKDSTEPRIIKLDILGGSTWVISDNGPGVAIRDRELIFERGFTRKPGGRGMGLRISRDVLAREEYDLLLADSKPGDGATFLIKPKPLIKKGER